MARKRDAVGGSPAVGTAWASELCCLNGKHGALVGSPASGPRESHFGGLIGEAGQAFFAAEHRENVEDRR